MERKKLLMMKGLPGSGKSTIAKALARTPGWKRVNKDDLRDMIDDGKFSRIDEEIIKNKERELARDLLVAGYNVVVDDTNFVYEDFWESFAKAMDVDFEINHVDTPVQECLLRNALRGDKAVPVDAIWRMYRMYVQPSFKRPGYDKDLSDCYIFDIDGTLAHMKNRSPFEWSRVGEDELDEPTANILDSVAKGAEIFIVSGRDAVCRSETEEWLAKHDIPYKTLYMRPLGDKRPDTDVKREIYENNIKGKYNVMGVFDDRDSVVQLWRSLGLKCYQCEYGAF